MLSQPSVLVAQIQARLDAELVPSGPSAITSKQALTIIVETLYNDIKTNGVVPMGIPVTVVVPSGIGATTAPSKLT